MQNVENLKTLNHLRKAMVDNIATARLSLRAESDRLARLCATNAEDWKIRHAASDVASVDLKIRDLDRKISRMSQLIEVDDAGAFRMAVTWALGEMR